MEMQARARRRRSLSKSIDAADPVHFDRANARSGLATRVDVVPWPGSNDGVVVPMVVSRMTWAVFRLNWRKFSVWYDNLKVIDLITWP